MEVDEAEQNVPPPIVTTCRSVPWWTDLLTTLRRDSGLAYNRQRAGRCSLEESTAKRNRYNSAIKSAKKQSWENYCSKISGYHPAARVFKILSKDKTREPTAICRPDASKTSYTADTLKELLHYHFPFDTPPISTWDHSRSTGPGLIEAVEVTTREKLTWAI